MRSPLYLAALASAAVPDLDPVSVEALATDPDHPYEVAFVQDSEHRRWVVRAPRTAAASAHLEQSAPLLGLLARRGPVTVPVPKGFAVMRDGLRASVHAYITGHHLDLEALPPGPGLAADLGRVIGRLHNVDRAVYEEAGMPAYDAEEYRSRRLAELDRAAATGRVPTALLSRWEHALEDVALWRFAPAPVHGALGAGAVIVHFDGEDASSGLVKAFTGWESAKVADPADDFADLVTGIGTESLDTVFEAYAHARVERPDRHLVTRARLVGELRRVGRLLDAVTSQDEEAAGRHEAALQELARGVDAGEADDLSPAATPMRRAPLSEPAAADSEDGHGAARTAEETRGASDEASAGPTEATDTPAGPGETAEEPAAGTSGGGEVDTAAEGEDAAEGAMGAGTTLVDMPQSAATSGDEDDAVAADQHDAVAADHARGAPAASDHAHGAAAAADHAHEATADRPEETASPPSAHPVGRDGQDQHDATSADSAQDPLMLRNPELS